MSPKLSNIIWGNHLAGVLESVKVLDFTHAHAGPLCTMLLAQLGAEVTKVEIPEGGDRIRSVPPLVGKDESYIGVILSRGKKSITLNMKSKEGLQIALRLAEKADVIVDNFRPGVMANLGLDYSKIISFNPTVICASSTGFGATGPRHMEPAWDSITQAAGGLMSVNGYPDRPPLRVGITIADYLAGIYTTLAITAALLYRKCTGEGQNIDMSMQDIIWSLVAIEHSPNYFTNGEIPQRTGNATSAVVPSNNYTTKDGIIRLSAGAPNQWDRLLKIIGREDLIGLERFSGMNRFNNIAEMDEIIGSWSAGLTTEEMLRICGEADIPANTIPSFEQVANDPQLMTRNMIVELEHAISGKLKVPGSVFKMSKTPGDPYLPAPSLGEHNLQVYSELLGYNEGEIQRLKEEGVI